MSSSLAVFQNVTTSDNTTTLFILYNIIVPGNYSVGVAAVNSAGMSPVTFYEEFLGRCVLEREREKWVGGCWGGREMSIQEYLIFS